METLIFIILLIVAVVTGIVFVLQLILLIVAVVTGTVFVLQFINMVYRIFTGGKASLCLLMPIICAVCLYLMNKL